MLYLCHGTTRPIKSALKSRAWGYGPALNQIPGDRRTHDADVAMRLPYNELGASNELLVQLHIRQRYLPICLDVEETRALDFGYVIRPAHVRIHAMHLVDQALLGVGACKID